MQKNLHMRYNNEYMSKNPLVSVIVPVYNTSKEFLLPALDSLQKQTYKNIEVIIVDDGSNQETARLLDIFSDKLSSWRVIRQENSGLSAARNTGFHKAKGKYVQFLDADDFFKPNLIKTAVAAAEKVQADIVIENYIVQDYVTKEEGLRFKNDFCVEKDIFVSKEIPYGRIGVVSHNVWSKLFRRSFLVDNRILHDEELKRCEDSLFTSIALVSAKKVAYSDDVQLIYRNNIPSSNSSSNDSHPESSVVSWSKLRDYLVKRGIFTDVQSHYEIAMFESLFWHYTKMNTNQGRRDLIFAAKDFIENQEIITKHFFLDIIETDYKLYKNGWGGYKSYYSDGMLSKYHMEFTEAGRWVEEAAQYLQGDVKAMDSLGERYMRIIQSGTARTMREGTFTENMESIAQAVVSYQKSLQSDNENRKKVLKDLRQSRSWRITKPLREVMANSLVRRILTVVRKSVGLLTNPKKFLQFVKRKYKDARGAILYKNAWVISDRKEEAADNGILFYDYMAKNHPEINAVYVILKSSDDYDMLKKRGVKLVEHGSDEHQRLIRHADVEMSAFFNYAHFNLQEIGRKKHLPKAFIRHGIEQSDLSEHYDRMGLDLYCDVLKVSKDFYMSGKSRIDVSGRNIQVTGMPRYDLLREMKNKKAKKRDAIVIAPTWRRFLLYKPGTIDRQPDGFLKESLYYKNYTRLFNSKKIKKLSEKCEIILIPHPELLARIDEFDIPEYIKIKTYKQLGTKGLYNLALRTDLFVSDFSSTTFDFAFLGANITHFSFDEDDYYSYKHGLYKSWFDIKRDGFGPCITDVSELIDYIVGSKRIKNQNNIDTVWSQVPKNSSELIYKEIKKIIEEQE